jgi:2-succinyl-5-enolpyruvyl-6-hydroxy-3-cyclohexene-1-carboxylate synthase
MEAKIGMYDIADICAMHGVKQAVMCPGSRCAPLTLAFSRHREISCHSIIDERSAGFIALGIAETTQKPVVLICTSGSASLNFAPAISEAFYRNIPLLVFTADRPERLLHQQDGQTLNQRALFANFIKSSYFLSGDIKEKKQLRYLHRNINEALLRSSSGGKGPVHVNLTFEEPLYALADSAQPPAFIRYCESLFAFEKELTEAMGKTNKWMLILGSRSGDAKSEALINKLSAKMPVLAEGISNAGNGSVLLNANETISFASDEGLKKLMPGGIISIGKGVVSKKLKNFIRNNPALFHFHHEEGETLIDTFECLTHQVRLPESHVLESLCEISEKLCKASDSEFLTDWKNFSEETILRTAEILAELPFSDITVMQTVAKNCTGEADIHVGNSMAVRYLNLFANHISPSTRIYCNRGTSGIDGSLSTAVGNSLCGKKPIWAILGDLSFHYDQNALWNALVPENFSIIILNNSGGGIFRLIDGPRSVSEITERFEVRTESSAEWKAREAGFGYIPCKNHNELVSAMHTLQKQSGKIIVEIFTDPIINENAFKQFQKQVRQII